MKELHQCVMDQIERNKEMTLFFNNIMDNSNVYLFGGAVRDYLDYNFENARDLDFVVDFKNNSDTIEKFMINDLKYQKNRYNGYKIFLNGISIDMWEMKDTWAFAKRKLQQSPQNLLNSVFLNFDSVLYSMNECSYINECNYKYLMRRKNKVLDIVLEDNPFIDLNLLRALVMRKKYNLSFSDNLNRILEKRYNEVDLISSLMDLQQSHYKAEILTKCYIEKALSETI